MSAPLLTEFATPEALVRAMRLAQADGHRALDAFTPFPVPDLTDAFAPSRNPVRPIMAVAGFGAAAAMYALQWYSSVIAYPLNSGGRPLHSWPVFLAMFWACGLPRLHHPLFAIPQFERASQDRFLLLVAAKDADATALRESLERAGALLVAEMHP
jgi:Protein of unknown function (DUF3341)